ncbi:MAG TPA: gluconate 2-dehydrogenase subunit 3 family protein [Steroidobacteraceae bacterium]|jgi:gluconate 2-dehydrogenase gamma chain|nr:gluconate 2-dehydrogenase subunit 3 family protein [Steroidobacteraceae bacterium]
MTDVRRRDLLTGTAFVLMGTRAARAGIVAGSLPWAPEAGSPPTPVKQGPWLFFTAAEVATMEALADRIIPPDPETPGGRQAGCAVFLDRQLAGPYGQAEGLYDQPPFEKGTKTQGPQSSATPAELYRTALAALDQYARSQGASAWATLSAEHQDAALSGLENGTIPLQGLDAQAFFATLVKDVKEGFFADPLYGGNRDMCAWKMIGYPGAHYDYRDWVGRHNERYPHPPVSIMGRPGWTPKT